MNLYKVRINGKSGYIDDRSNVTIDARYDFGTEFREGFAIVKLQDEFHIIDKNGKPTARLREGSPDIHGFSYGRACVKLSGKEGYIDQYAQFVIYPKYITAERFDKYGAFVRISEDGWGRIDFDGRWQSEYRYEFAWDFRAGAGFTGAKNADRSWCVIDTQGKPCFGQRFFRVNQESEKLIPVKFRDADRRCYGWIDTNGNRVVGATFDNIGNYFHDGLIMAELDDRWGLVDATGRWVVEPKYARLVDGSAGRWPFTLNDDDELYGLIDRAGNVIAPQRFTYGTSFENELAPVDVLDGNESYSGYIDKSGKLVWRDS